MANSRTLQGFPWAQKPIIANAPMSGIATSDLAAAVTRAGGVGLIGFLDDLQELDRQLERAKGLLQGIEMTPESADILPVGVGVIVFAKPDPSAFSPLLAKYKPAVVWLSFGETVAFKQWTDTIRKASPLTKIWVQVGSVSAALDIAQSCRPDALVLQGSDAGGHGHARGSSIVTLLPETTNVLTENGLGDISLVAAGGIMNGSSVAGAIALGASGVVMGTRFLGAEETELLDEYRREILLASDGGESTVRSRVFDEMRGANFWPDRYDGRCLRNAIYDDLQEGLDINEIRSKLHDRLHESLDANVSFKDTNSLWVGTGVGMVKAIEKAGDIVEEVREAARQRLHDLANYI